MGSPPPPPNFTLEAPASSPSRAPSFLGTRQRASQAKAREGKLGMGRILGS